MYPENASNRIDQTTAGIPVNFSRFAASPDFFGVFILITSRINELMTESTSMMSEKKVAAIKIHSGSLKYINNKLITVNVPAQNNPYAFLIESIIRSNVRLTSTKRICKWYPFESNRRKINPHRADVGYPAIAMRTCRNLFLALVTIFPEVSANKFTAITSPLTKRVISACPDS